MPEQVDGTTSMTDREAAIYWMDRWDTETTELRDRLNALGGGPCWCKQLTQGECNAYGLVTTCPGDPPRIINEPTYKDGPVVDVRSLVTDPKFLVSPWLRGDVEWNCDIPTTAQQEINELPYDAFGIDE